MRILFVTGEFPPMQGGVGDYTREIALALTKLGCQVHVATSVQAGPVTGLVVHPVVERWNWGSWRTILDLARNERPDVVHVQYQAAAYAMHPAVNFLPRRIRSSRLTDPHAPPRTAVTFHDLRVPYLFPKAGPLRRWVVDELARSSDVAIATNREDFEALRHTIKDRPVPPALIPIGSNIAPQLPADYDRDIWRRRWGVGPDDLLLCFFGFVNARKGVDTLLRALQIIVSDTQRAVHPRLLMLGGQTGSSDPTNVTYLGTIQALIGELGLADRVSWSGYLPAEEVSASFMAADLVVLPFREGVSFLHGTFHAALAHGAAIITTRPRIVLPELVEGENIVFVPPEDPHALAEAIVELAGEPGRRSALGKGARVLSGHFGWDQIAADTLHLYQAIGAG